MQHDEERGDDGEGGKEGEAVGAEEVQMHGDLR
jgi:hypothetical protein